jgi:UDP-GlcNAc:undecaprenyl-phosphate/decaprenyl-phosphate GlcNAc-1-phosphate transferase
VILYLYRFENYSRTVFVIYAVILLLLLAGSRASFRLVGEFVSRRQSSGRRCVIYGTGGARIGTIRDAFGVGDLRILGFVDESPHEQSRIAGYPVIGGYEELLRLISRAEVDCIVMNTHLVDVERLQRLEAACRDHDVELLRLDVHLKPMSAVS